MQYKTKRLTTFLIIRSNKMKNSTIYCTGSDILKAAIAGAKRGYNRSTDDYSSYETSINNSYNAVLHNLSDPKLIAQVTKHTGNNWRNAKISLHLALIHSHKNSNPCEPHARVYLSHDNYSFFDIPLSSWQRLSAKSKKMLKAANM